MASPPFSSGCSGTGSDGSGVCSATPSCGSGVDSLPNSSVSVPEGSDVDTAVSSADSGVIFATIPVLLPAANAVAG